LTDPTPVWTPPYPIPINQRPVLKKYIDEMSTQGIISRSTSPYSSPVVLVKKKNNELRLCIDYRKLNQITVKNRHPIPRINDLTSYFKGAKIFSTVDLFSGFWQIEVNKKDRFKTAFTCEMGHYQFNRLPFGLCNSPATFQSLMFQILDKVLNKFALVYLDDVIIYSDTIENHISHLRTVLKMLSEAGLKIKPDKCEFAKKEIIYLGHIISSEGIKPNSLKVKAVSEYPIPKNVDQLRTFLGIANYYRRYIKDFAKIAHCLTELTKKNKEWIWDNDQNEAFNALKNRLTSSPILGHPNLESGQYLIDTDASQYGVGAVLRQNQNGIDKVIAYTSQHLNDTQSKWSTFDKEFYAIVHAILTFHVYIHGTNITVYSDHKPLEKVLDNHYIHGKLSRWKMILASYDITIRYRPGKSNQNADTLSRIPVESGEKSTMRYVSIITKGILPCKEEFIIAQDKDRYCIYKKSTESAKQEN
jgi:hypothetical protein